MQILLTNQIYLLFIAIKNAIRIIYDKDCFAHTQPFLKHVKALTTNEINLFQIFPLTFKCKNRTVTFFFW